MKGIINKGIQDMVVRQMGQEAWDNVRSITHFDDAFFVIALEYPDSLTFALIEAVANLKGVSQEQAIEDCGRFMVPNTLKESYPRYFENAGQSPREFLMNMDKVHKQVTDAIAHAKPPRFSYEQLPNGNLRMHYHSERNLYPFLKGLIYGVGDYFHSRLTVTEFACTKQGNDHCSFDVSFCTRSIPELVSP